mmetsp:Transcript_32999/g.37458  ORF Transcript_32999/g.37458 Transcript_32999/m.37458 type:complete len:216 (-) Transcript_32999:359-1006(-)
MSLPKLHYFEGHGRGDVIKFALDLNGIEWEDVFYTVPSFEAVKTSGLFPAKQLPILEYEGQVMNQTKAIVTYFCNKLYSISDSEKGYLEAWYLESLGDFSDKFYVEYIFGPNEEAKERSKKLFLEEIIPTYYKQFEKKILETNAIDSHYLVGDGPTPATLYFLSITTAIFYDGGRDKDFLPTLKEHAPKVVEYVETVKKNEFSHYFEKTRKVYPF